MLNLVIFHGLIMTETRICRGADFLVQQLLVNEKNSINVNEICLETTLNCKYTFTTFKFKLPHLSRRDL